MLRLWLIKLMPFLSRWSEAAPAACCGMCAPCITATVTGLSAEAVASRQLRRDEAASPGAQSAVQPPAR